MSLFLFHLRRILLNYAVYNPEMGYCQGMSDLVAPLLTEIQDESDTFWCFVGLMENTIFISSPRDEDMERQLVSCHRLGLRAKISAQLISEQLISWACLIWQVHLGLEESFEKQNLLLYWRDLLRHFLHVSFCHALSADVPARALAFDVATFSPAPDATRWGRPAATFLPSLGSALLQTRVSWHWGAAHVGGLLGSLPGTNRNKIRTEAETAFDQKVVSSFAL